MRKQIGWFIFYVVAFMLFCVGICYADTKEEAEIEIRARQTCFTPGEKTLIHCSEAKD